MGWTWNGKLLAIIYKEHPDWIYHYGLVSDTSREGYVLNMTKKKLKICLWNVEFIIFIWNRL